MYDFSNHHFGDFLYQGYPYKFISSAVCGLLMYNSGLTCIKCPEQDSNLHTVASASPSSWCVYQFRHLGNKDCKFINYP